jgi:hypothetical protein
MMAPNEWACNRNSSFGVDSITSVDSFRRDESTASGSAKSPSVYTGDSVVMPINPCTWSGITTHASNRTYDRTMGVRCHSRAATHPDRVNPMMPFRTRPKNGRRSAVQIVTKYHADCR